jgi:hypothetical protein
MSASEQLKALEATIGSESQFGRTERAEAAEPFVRALPQIVAVVERDERLIVLAEGMFQMIPQEVWREHGAEWMGQYEGDYHAEKVRDELVEHRTALTALDEALS